MRGLGSALGMPQCPSWSWHTQTQARECNTGQVLCANGQCAVDFSHCHQTCSSGSILCPDGTCVSAASDCAGIQKCPPSKPYLCATGICRFNSTACNEDCPSKAPFLCSDGICRANCHEFNGCGQQIQCVSGKCVNDTSLCKGDCSSSSDFECVTQKCVSKHIASKICPLPLFRKKFTSTTLSNSHGTIQNSVVLKNDEELLGNVTIFTENPDLGYDLQILSVSDSLIPSLHYVQDFLVSTAVSINFRPDLPISSAQVCLVVQPNISTSCRYICMATISLEGDWHCFGKTIRVPRNPQSVLCITLDDFNTFSHYTPTFAILDKRKGKCGININFWAGILMAIIFGGVLVGVIIIAIIFIIAVMSDEDEDKYSEADNL